MDNKLMDPDLSSVGPRKALIFTHQLITNGVHQVVQHVGAEWESTFKPIIMEMKLKSQTSQRFRETTYVD
jgi:hypothetical protein